MKTFLDTKAEFEIDLKTLTNVLDYDYKMSANFTVEHVKLITKSLNKIAKQIEKAAKQRLEQLK